MTNWKQGDKCEIHDNNGAHFKDCEILYIDSMSVVFSSSAASSCPRYLSDIEIRPTKTPAEIEQEELESEIKLVLKVKTDNLASTLAYNLYDSGYRKFGPEITGIQT